MSAWTAALMEARAGEVGWRGGAVAVRRRLRWRRRRRSVLRRPVSVRCVGGFGREEDCRDRTALVSPRGGDDVFGRNTVNGAVTDTAGGEHEAILRAGSARRRRAALVRTATAERDGGDVAAEQRPSPSR